jgi:hypothetical protein
VIDFFAVYNREPGGLPDYQANPTALWIKQNTPPDAIFLNSMWFYHPANLVGRYIFSGYPYFTWSYGYDKDKRESILKLIYDAPDKQTACRLLQNNRISYVELADHYDEYFRVNYALWGYEFKPVYRNTQEEISIFDVSLICENI